MGNAYFRVCVSGWYQKNTYGERRKRKMKKILVGLIAFGLLIAMTGVVVPAACCEWDYCKVNGGGMVHDEVIGDITVTFHATAYSKVKGEVHIVYHESKKKLKLDVESVNCGLCEKNGDSGYYANLCGSDADGDWCLSVVDFGEGSKAEPDIISFTGFRRDSAMYYTGYNSKAEGHSFDGNVQVKCGIFT
jgi:hypothetical protein